ncbi:MAG TPA: multicopper oxidase domain-containing protein [Burkholderiales bacterium]|jgi:suppressor of ftsI/bilirubin oxidase
MSANPRRKFLIAAGTAAGAAGIAGALLWHRRSADERAGHLELPPVRDPAFPNPLRLPSADGLYGLLDAAGSFAMVAKPARQAPLPGKPGPNLAYEVEYQGKTLLNPVLRMRTGTQLRIKFWNALEETSIIHWHGLKVDSNNDGHPHYAVPGGATYDYHFTVANRAATYWYHPHPHPLTGKQVYLGLAGLFIVEDDEDAALQKTLDLAFGVNDVPLIIQDRRFDGDGRLVFAPTREERFQGQLGTEVLVNLTPRPHFRAATRIHRFRILNGSNARVYRLAFRHGEQLLAVHVIGGDGGLLDRPRTVTEAFLAPSERLDVLLDLRSAAVGDTITLVSLPFDPMHHETGSAGDAHGGHAAHGVLADGAEVEIMSILVSMKVVYDRVVPQALSRIGPLPEPAATPRVITLDQKNRVWRINGMTYDMRATPIAVKRGAVETWDVRNAAASMPHPMHIHGFQFRVTGREGSPEQVRSLALDGNGLTATDLGWKDTVLAWPGETVRIVTDFSHPFLGDQVYMVHCHNLEHEDGGMMLNLKVAA